MKSISAVFQHANSPISALYWHSRRQQGLFSYFVWLQFFCLSFVSGNNPSCCFKKSIVIWSMCYSLGKYIQLKSWLQSGPLKVRLQQVQVRASQDWVWSLKCDRNREKCKFHQMLLKIWRKNKNHILILKCVKLNMKVWYLSTYLHIKLLSKPQ